MTANSSLSKYWLALSWQEAANLCLLLMEGIWLAYACSYLSTFDRPVAPWKALSSLPAILLAGYFLARRLRTWQVRPGIQRGALAGLILLSLWVMLQINVFAPGWLGPWDTFRQVLTSFASPSLIPTEFYVLLFTALLWQRGIRLASEEVLEHQLLSSLLAGCLASLLPGVISGWAVWPGWLWLLIGCSGLGLSGMAAARLAHLGELRGGYSPRFSRRWLVSVAVGAWGVVGIGAGLALLLLGKPGQIIGQIVQIILGAISALFLLLTLPLLGLLEKFIRWMMTRAANDNTLSSAFNRILEQIGNLTNQTEESGAPSVSLFDVIKPYLLWGVLLILLLSAIYFLVQRWQVLRRRREELADPVNAGMMLRDAWKSLQNGFEQMMTAISDRLQSNQAGRLLQAMRIRWVYAQLMRLCNQKGQPRPQAVTPLEFMPVLGELFPGKTAAIQTITQAYLRIRYGMLPETNTEIEDVLRAWDSIRQA